MKIEKNIFYIKNKFGEGVPTPSVTINICNTSLQAFWA